VLPAVVVLVALVVTCIICATSPSWLSIYLLVVSSVGWLLVNGPMEGSVLWAFSETHGITVADLVSLFGFAVAGWGAARLLRYVPS
jgi:hypothetical protein